MSTTPPQRPSHLFYQTRLRRPLLERGEGVYLWDRNGRRFLDGSSGAMVSNIGHSNPRVLAAMQEQMNKATFGYRLHFEVEPAEQLAAKVADWSPPGLNRVFFTSGGSETIESCLKLARQYALANGEAQRYKVISRFPSYHGSTLGTLAITGYTALTAAFDPMLQPMPKIAAPRAYLDRLDPADPATGHYYADLLEQQILAEGAETVLAFIIEPVGGASTGALPPPAAYLQRIREICDRYGVLLIHDEVMCGGGRCGQFLAADYWQVAPDIVALSKGFAAGYAPLGGMIAHERIVEPVLEHGGFLHGYTYAGNPLACAAGLAVLSEIEQQGLMDNATQQGALLRERLTGLLARYPFIGEVRGMGLLLAFELFDRDTLQPLPRELNAYQSLVEIAYQNGLIIYSRRTRGGYEGDHFMICPPLIVNTEQLDELMALLIRSLDQFAAQAGLPVVNAVAG
ncbi:MAG: aspartate aminotransferase family protein [Thiolinea sp.]